MSSGSKSWRPFTTGPTHELLQRLARISHRKHRTVVERKHSMTPQEQQMIDGLIDRIRNTQLTDRDTQAARLGSNPEAGWTASSPQVPHSRLNPRATRLNRNSPATRTSTRAPSS